MVAFFHSTNPSNSRQPGKQWPVFLSKNVGNTETEDNDETFPRSGRIRRQTTNNNRKRSKENEEFGNWNPYAGINFFFK